MTTTTTRTTPLSQLDFTGDDFENAQQFAAHLGYEQTAYTSSSALVGLFCLPENPRYSKGPHRGGCIIKTKELGFMFVQLAEDCGLEPESFPLESVSKEDARRVGRQIVAAAQKVRS